MCPAALTFMIAAAFHFRCQNSIELRFRIFRYISHTCSAAGSASVGAMTATSAAPTALPLPLLLPLPLVLSQPERNSSPSVSSGLTIRIGTTDAFTAGMASLFKLSLIPSLGQECQLEKLVVTNLEMSSSPFQSQFLSTRKAYLHTSSIRND